MKDLLRDLSLSAIATCLVASPICLLIGVSGACDRIRARLPGSIAAALALFGASRGAPPAERDAGLFTFLASASLVSFLGLSAAFRVPAHRVMSSRRGEAAVPAARPASR